MRRFPSLTFPPHTLPSKAIVFGAGFGMYHFAIEGVACMLLQPGIGIVVPPPAHCFTSAALVPVCVVMSLGLGVGLRSFVCDEMGSQKTKHETRQDKTGRDRTRQIKTRQDKTGARQDKTRHDMLLSCLALSRLVLSCLVLRLSCLVLP